MKQLCIRTLGAGLLTLFAGLAQAGTVFDLLYSGVASGNNATANGTITLDLAAMNNPGVTYQSVTPFVTDFSLTISGASSGNGTFDFADFNGASFGGFYLDTNGGALDFTRQLDGQSTAGSPWGSVPSLGDAGDFNIFSSGADPSAPSGTFYFQITTNGGAGDSLNLTSFAPAGASAPEPAFAVPTVAMLLFMAYWARRRVNRESIESRAC